MYCHYYSSSFFVFNYSYCTTVHHFCAMRVISTVSKKSLPFLPYFRTYVEVKKQESENNLTRRLTNQPPPLHPCSIGNQNALVIFIFVRWNDILIPPVVCSSQIQCKLMKSEELYEFIIKIDINKPGKANKANIGNESTKRFTTVLCMMS